MRAVSARTVRRYGLDLAAMALMTAIAGSSSAALAAGKTIDGVSPRKFAFGAMAIGQAKDVDYARARIALKAQPSLKRPPVTGAPSVWPAT